MDFNDPAYDYVPGNASAYTQSSYVEDGLLDEPIEDDYASSPAQQSSYTAQYHYSSSSQTQAYTPRRPYQQQTSGAGYARAAPLYASPSPIGSRRLQSARVPAGTYLQAAQGPLRQQQQQHGYGAPSRFSAPAVQEEPRQQTVHGIKLRPVSDLPDVYRGLFKFSVFNAVQSKCFEALFHSEGNMVVTAPTGSGKTVLFELAIIRLVSNDASKTSKCVYMAPTKALCSERFRDWSKKFEPLGINCCELTGDTVTYGKGAWGDAYASRVIVTTPEKWDSLTRHWAEHENILAQMQLFLVDEVHILNESRGSTLEVCVARMKLRGSAVRFVLVSATAPNISDIAAWIGQRGSMGESAETFIFGEEFRPCQLKRHIYSYPPKPNEFQFQKTLDFKLYAHLQQHSVNKPILVFCPTRKGTVQTAEQLMKDFKQAKSSRMSLPWHAPQKIEGSFKDAQLQALAEAGIGVHHAGVAYPDRLLTEELYSKRILRVIVATSTLAVGVNLPAHTVVIKGTKLFQGQGWSEYSEADIFQMMGRAGRPQFDKDGIAIIMCSTVDEAKYNNLVGGTTNLESCLHLNLAEHINSEVGLGTITDVDTAKAWLKNSFFYQRIQKNPAHYRLGKASTQTWTERLEEIVVESVDDLKESGLVSKEEETANLVATEFGDIMSKYYIRLSTMKLLLAMPRDTSLKSILEVMCTADELSEVRLRFGEKQVYNKLREHNDIRFATNKVEKTSDKLFVLIQAILGGISLTDKEYELGGQAHLDAIPVLKHCPRFARAIADIGVAKRSGSQTKYGLELLRCFHAKAWEGRPVVLRQIEHLGDKSIKVLIQHGITTFSKLREQDQIRIEALLNRRPPFGLDVISAAKELPEFHLKIVDSAIETHGGREEVHCTLTIECSVTVEQNKQKRRKQKQSLGFSSVVTVTSDDEFVDFRRISLQISTKILAQEPKTFSIRTKLSRPSQYVEVSISADNFAGVLRSVTWKPDIHPGEFPVPDTRPKTAIDMEVEMCMKDPDFWDAFDEPLRTDSEEPEKPKETPSKILHALDTVKLSLPTEPTPSKRSDGKYECNHSCKDKTCCRHLCCRDGLEHPPKTTKAVAKSQEKAANALRTDLASESKKPRLTLHGNRGPQRSPSQPVKLDSGDNRFLGLLRQYAPSKNDGGSPISHSTTAKKRKLSSWEDENAVAAPSSDDPCMLNFFEPDDLPPPPRKRSKVTKRLPTKAGGSRTSNTSKRSVTSSLLTVSAASPRKPALPKCSPTPPLFLPNSPLFLPSSDDFVQSRSAPSFSDDDSCFPVLPDKSSSTMVLESSLSQNSEKFPASEKGSWFDEFDDHLTQADKTPAAYEAYLRSSPPATPTRQKPTGAMLSITTPPPASAARTATATPVKATVDPVAESMKEDLAMFEEWLRSGNVVIED